MCDCLYASFCFLVASYCLLAFPDSYFIFEVYEFNQFYRSLLVLFVAVFSLFVSEFYVLSNYSYGICFVFSYWCFCFDCLFVLNTQFFTIYAFSHVLPDVYEILLSWD